MSLNLDFMSPNECMSAYNTTISWILDNHAPLKVRKTSSRKKVPWYNEEIANTIRCSRKAKVSWLSDKSDRANSVTSISPEGG